MEKETLEEAAYQARKDYQDEVGKDGMHECIMFDAMKIQKGFELGAKWQAERLYSAEEVKHLLSFIRELRDNWDCDTDSHRYGTQCRCCEAEQILEQFKKK